VNYIEANLFEIGKKCEIYPSEPIFNCKKPIFNMKKPIKNEKKSIKNRKKSIKNGKFPEIYPGVAVFYGKFPEKNKNFCEIYPGKPIFNEKTCL